MVQQLSAAQNSYKATAHILKILADPTRLRLLARTRSILQRNWQLTRERIDAQHDVFTYAAPQAGAMLFLSYSADINSTDLAERLRKQQSVLVVPGDHYGMDGFLRIGYGCDERTLTDGLERLRRLNAELQPKPA